jgi:hypothetical protein
MACVGRTVEGSDEPELGALAHLSTRGVGEVLERTRDRRFRPNDMIGCTDRSCALVCGACASDDPCTPATTRNKPVHFAASQSAPAHGSALAEAVADVSNAWKLTSEVPLARIELGATQAP